jgi:hypothetical protein
MSKPRAFTDKEVRQQLFASMRSLSKYWAAQNGTIEDRMDGLCFSLLNIFDGNTMALPAIDITLDPLPAMKLSPAPHDSDKAYLKKQGENWYEKGMLINNCQMHEEWHPSKPKA